METQMEVIAVVGNAQQTANAHQMDGTVILEISENTGIISVQEEVASILTLVRQIVTIATDAMEQAIGTMHVLAGLAHILLIAVQTAHVLVGDTTKPRRH